MLAVYEVATLSRQEVQVEIFPSLRISLEGISHTYLVLSHSFVKNISHRRLKSVPAVRVEIMPLYCAKIRGTTRISDICS
jgi:hypothetical protein